MPQLRREGKLLRTVGGRVHASSDDHEDDSSSPRKSAKSADTKRRQPRRSEVESSMPTPPGTNSSFGSQKEPEVVNLEEDDDDFVNADPIDSDEEVMIPRSGGKSVDSARSVSNVPAFRTPSAVGGAVNCGKKESAPKFHVLGAEDERDSGKSKKRKSSESVEKKDFQLPAVGNAFDNEPDWMPGPQQKRQKTEKQKNIHALSPKPKQAAAYGKVVARAKKRELERTASFQNAKTSPKKEKPKATFKTYDIEFGPDDGPLDSGFAVPGAANDDFQRLGSSSSLSSARTTPDPEEVDALDIPGSQPYETKTECSFCGQQVGKFVLEDFEDRHQTGGDLSFKWKRRFCKYHKEQEAKDLWRDRSYPDIDWINLQRRMRRHNAYLVDVLNDKTHSHYREKLKGKVKTKTTRKVFDALMDADEKEVNDAKPGASVGYYGPKGERIMMDHIISCLADDIRKQAKKDKLVAASGVQGGVSGFVQAVLVPHLAELLIKEDMKLTGDWFSQARGIIAESCEVGEILHPEVQDKVVEVADDSDDGYD